MLTRREILSGTAAASVAAIAIARGAEPVAAAGMASCSLGSDEGALASFVKIDSAFHAFMKWTERLAVDAFYKESPAGGVDVFIKFFQKGGWSDYSTVALNRIGTLRGAEAHFLKLDVDGASFFIKGENNVNVISTFSWGERGVQASVSEMPADGAIFDTRG